MSSVVDALLEKNFQPTREAQLKKKVALWPKINYNATTSAFIASAIAPGLSFAADVTLLVTVIREYQVHLSLDRRSLLAKKCLLK